MEIMFALFWAATVFVSAVQFKADKKEISELKAQIKSVEVLGNKHK
jgi:hypothetical protein